MQKIQKNLNEQIKWVVSIGQFLVYFVSFLYSRVCSSGLTDVIPPPPPPFTKLSEALYYFITILRHIYLDKFA